MINYSKKNPRLAFVLVTMLFLTWGMANNMNDTLLAAFKRIMSMSDLQTSLVQFAYYGSYFCFAIPAALFIRRFSYKSGIILGLLLYAAGTMLFTPAGNVGSYKFFLVAIYIMAGGCAILETTANPLIMALGRPETATRRLNIAQSFNPVGAIAGILLSRALILSELHDADAVERLVMSPEELAATQAHEFSAVSLTYMIVGIFLLLLTVIIILSPMTSERDDSKMNVSLRTAVASLWRNRRYRYGVVTQFFYVGAQTTVWSFVIRLAMQELNIREAAASDYILASVVLFTVCRFLFTWLMKIFKPAVLMAVASVGAMLMTLIVMLGSGSTAVSALVMISAFMSLMFPTIYGTAQAGITGGVAKIASSGLIMAIVGGALITPLQGYVSDLTGSVSLSVCGPLVCFIVTFIYSVWISNDDSKQ